MIVAIRKSFIKDAEKLPANIQRELYAVIDKLEKATLVCDIANSKKLTGFKNAFRIRLRNYRIGFFFENGTIELIRVLNRKDMYRFFPKPCKHFSINSSAEKIL